MTKRRVILSVTNDLSTDQRVHKVCISLQGVGYDVLLVGRKLTDSLPLNRSYSTKRFSLWFNKGPLFYANYNIRLFFFLLLKRANVLHANDLDTLPANYLVSRIRKTPLIYDSHEYFTEVPELINRPKVKKSWEWIEARIIPNLKHCFTVSGKIAQIYQKKYKVNFKVVRNFPLCKKAEDQSIEKFDIKTIIYQGALNMGRGLEELIKAMQDLEDYQLLLIGNGDIKNELERMSIELNLEERVIFLGRLSLEELYKQTTKAHLGVSLEKAQGLSYQYAVPNKVFDYIHAEIPVLYAPLSELKEILSEYDIGEVLESHEPQKIARQIRKMMESEQYFNWVDNCKEAKQKLNWEQEEETLKSIYNCI